MLDTVKSLSVKQNQETIPLIFVFPTNVVEVKGNEIKSQVECVGWEVILGK